MVHFPRDGIDKLDYKRSIGSSKISDLKQIVQTPNQKAILINRSHFRLHKNKHEF